MTELLMHYDDIDNNSWMRSWMTVLVNSVCVMGNSQDTLNTYFSKAKWALAKNQTQPRDFLAQGFSR